MIKTKVINNVEYEIETHDFNKTLAEIQIPKGWRLLKPSEAMMLWERETFTSWFFVEQPLKNTKDVVRFDANSYGAYLGCDWDATNVYSHLGVRFCRDLKEMKNEI